MEEKVDQEKVREIQTNEIKATTIGNRPIEFIECGVRIRGIRRMNVKEK